jgi:hypothetical protein
MSVVANSVSQPVQSASLAYSESVVRQRVPIAAAFGVGAVVGLVSNFVPAGPPMDVGHGISSLGIILGSALFAAWFARRGLDTVAVGFALLAVAQGVIVSGGTPTAPGAEATFAGGAALYALALLVASLPAALPVWVRIVGGLAAVPFGVHGLLWWLGNAPESAGPFASIGYMLLTVAMVGWIITVLRAAPSDR